MHNKCTGQAGRLSNHFMQNEVIGCAYDKSATVRMCEYYITCIGICPQSGRGVTWKWAVPMAEVVNLR